MIESVDFAPLEMRVIQAKKPGAFVDLWRKKKNDREVLENAGLEVRRSRFHDAAIAYPRPAIDIMQNISVPESGKVYESRVAFLIEQLSSMSVSGALSALDAMPRNSRYQAIWNAENPEVAIVEGALLGYEPCCVDYYVATRYLDLPEHPDVLRLDEHPLIDKWDNRHVLCGACAIGFTLEK